MEALAGHARGDRRVDRLCRLWRLSFPHPLHDRAGGLLEAITGLYARAGLAKPTMPLHCLRHTFGTVMARRVPLGVPQRLMGHSEVSTTVRYVDVGEEHKRDVIAAVFGAVGQQVGNKAQATGSTEAFSVENRDDNRW